MSTPTVPVPTLVLPAPFPTTADRLAGIYNAKAKAWADSEAGMAESLYSIAQATQNNATSAQEQAADAAASHAAAVVDTAAIRVAALAETGLVRDDAIAARDAAALSKNAALSVAAYKGQWSSLSGAMSVPASVWHLGRYWGLLYSIPSVAAQTPGVSAAWAGIGTNVQNLAYEQRGALRTLAPSVSEMVFVESLGAFVFEAASTEPDDDESCFAAGGGKWLLQAPHWDLIDAWQLPEAEDRNRLLSGTALCAVTSVAATASASFSCEISGAEVGDSVIVTPPGLLGSDATNTGRLGFYGLVSAANTVTVVLTNSSAAAATTNPAVRTAWPITVIKP